MELNCSLDQVAAKAAPTVSVKYSCMSLHTYCSYSTYLNRLEDKCDALHEPVLTSLAKQLKETCHQTIIAC